MASERFPLILYCGLLILYIVSIDGFSKMGKSLESSDDQNIKNILKFNLCFFTTWSLVFQIIFLLVAIIDEFIKLGNFLVKFQKHLQRFRTLFFHSFVFPTALFVIPTFWVIWTMDKELTMPKKLIEVCPVWLNHALHTSICFSLIIEILLVPKKDNFLKFKTVGAYVLAYSLLYNIMYYSIYFFNGNWLYPFYGKMNWNQRMMFSAYLIGSNLCFAKIGLTIIDLKKSPKSYKLK